MKYFTTLTVAAATMLVQAAQAADLPQTTVHAPTAQPAAYTPPVFTWTGFYAGVHAGKAFGAKLLPASKEEGAVGKNVNGFAGGLHAGYNYQFGRFVVGAEADIDRPGVEYKFNYTDIDPDNGAVINGRFRTRYTYAGTLRGRVGVAFDRALIYATGGLAYAGWQVDRSISSYNSATGGGFGLKDKKSGTSTGYTVGGGLEYAFMDNLTFRAEYLYTSLSNIKVRDPDESLVVSKRPHFSTVRAGLTYKF